MSLQLTHPSHRLPDASLPIIQQLHLTLNSAVRSCTDQSAQSASFFAFEQRLFPFVATLGRLLLTLFLVCRHHRLDLQPWLQDGRYRLKDEDAERTLDTRFGEVTYPRAYLIPKKTKGPGFHPLDIVLGLTRDRFSPWIVQFVTRLATRMSYGAATLICRAALNWSPSSESIEGLVLGLGRHTAPYMQQSPPPEGEGEVLVIEVDGKCTPTATAQELAKRRGKRKPRHEQGCPCGCQRHRGKQKRKARGPKKRRKKGDKSKNGREVVLVTMYTLKRGEDGLLHGPLNKKVWGTYAGKKAIALWARAQATKRGFGAGTSKTVEVVMDGAKGLRQALAKEFPDAWLTLDVRHVEERLWQTGRAFHAEGSEELAAWVKEWQELLYRGEGRVLVERLREELGRVSQRGPGTKGKRKALEKLIGYVEPRLEMMRYGELKERDLVVASGIVEGAARYVVGERMDCGGMRWIPGRGEAVLQLRCIELNGDWEEFFKYVQGRLGEDLRERRAVQIRTEEPLPVRKAA